jgi:hypothetical protein
MIREDVVNDLGDFFGDERSGDGLVGSLEHLLIEGTIFGKVLHRSNSGIGERKLQILIAILA